ncbi:MAG: tRNA (guanosine(46)-N7)-methyltransferase TrmB [Bacteroidia bacterium]|nr:tRNA (guanosine(46)-N7)-methyltransferase TrmB [Bacteroidia bacterium]
MGRKKLVRFAENAQAANVIQEGKEMYSRLKGQWRRLYFQNQHPLVLELGCGRGEYTVGLGNRFPENNYVGIDMKGARFWKGSQIALQQQLGNIAFLRTPVQNLDVFFAPKEVNEIWITFPDPRPKDRDEKRRLTHPRFLAMYRDLLTPGGLVHLKTDNDGFFEYTLSILEKMPIRTLRFTRDIYASYHLKNLHHGIQTTYEAKFVAQGYKIKYMQFSFVHPEIQNQPFLIE